MAKENMVQRFVVMLIVLLICIPIMLYLRNESIYLDLAKAGIDVNPWERGVLLYLLLLAICALVSQMTKPPLAFIVSLTAIALLIGGVGYWYYRTIKALIYPKSNMSDFLFSEEAASVIKENPFMFLELVLAFLLICLVVYRVKQPMASKLP